MTLKNAKRAEMGMGTLIIFIALILVAAVTAGVLISTTGTLQNKALATGKATSSEVGTSLFAIETFAENGSNQEVEYFYETIKLSAGSEAIRLSDVLLTFNLDNMSAEYAYSTSVNCSNTSTMAAGGDFGADYQIEGNNFRSGYLNTGDIARICFTSPRNVTESEDVRITIIPQVGSPLVVETTTPQLMVSTRIPIFP